MANEMSISSSSSSYTPNTSSVNIPAKPKVVDTTSDAVLQSVANQTVFNIQTSIELKRAELAGSQLSLGEEQMVKTIERANKALEGRSTTFEFSIHKQTKQISIKVLDKDTGEIIREIPPEKTLDMVAKMWEMAGLLVDERR
jgi:flagellar protein FlaG